MSKIMMMTMNSKVTRINHITYKNQIKSKIFLMKKMMVPIIHIIM